MGIYLERPMVVSVPSPLVLAQTSLDAVCRLDHRALTDVVRDQVYFQMVASSRETMAVFARLSRECPLFQVRAEYHRDTKKPVPHYCWRIPSLYWLMRLAVVYQTRNQPGGSVQREYQILRQNRLACFLFQYPKHLALPSRMRLSGNQSSKHQIRPCHQNLPRPNRNHPHLHLHHQLPFRHQSQHVHW